MSSNDDIGLASLLYRAASATPERGITYETGNGSKAIHMTYKGLLGRAITNAQKLRQIHGIKAGSVVLLHFEDMLDGILWFWSTVLAGYLPALSPPFSSDQKQHEKHINHLYELLSAPTVITNDTLTSRFTGQISSSVYTTTDILSLETVSPEMGNFATSKPGNENAVLMLTSGSTGQAKAVCLRNNQILNAVKGKVDCHATTENDVFLNWINLDHVANLTESHLHALYLNAEQIHVDSSQLLADPVSYLEIISRHRVTFSFAPNFFLNSLSRSLRTDVQWKCGKPELSSLRTITSGGEALNVKTCERLLSQMCAYGSPENLIVPGFGMTETCAGIIHNLSFPVYDREIGLEFASLGTCHEGVSLRVVNDEGAVCGADVPGQLQLSGPSIFTEYFNNTSATRNAFTADGWFMTGDIAIVDSAGMLRLVGRSKDVVNINGVKYPIPSLTTALEDANIPGITPSFTVLIDYRPPGQDTESLVVLYLPAYSPDDAKLRADTDDAIARTILLNCGTRPHAIIPLNITMLQKTSLGKLSVGKLRTAFEEGRFDEEARAHKSLIASYRASAQEQPKTETERLIQKVMTSILEMDPCELGVMDGLLDQGINSMHLSCSLSRAYAQGRPFFGFLLITVCTIDLPRVSVDSYL